MTASDVSSGTPLAELEEWFSRNGWAGYDPYDIRGQEWFVRLFGYQTLFHRKVRGVLSLIERDLPPLALRRFLGVRKEINAKAMGLMASAFLTRFRTTGETRYLDSAQEILRWLASNSSQGYRGISWGYPFHWQSRIFIPRGTPSVVVTGTVGDAWLDHYELTHSPQSLALAHRIAEFMLGALNRYEKSADQICFSYTPLDHFKVHNANLFAGAFLARLGAISGRPDYGDLALKAASYTISEQNPDGSFYYWGSEPPTLIDHYHTGFVLRHLDTIRRSIGARFIAAPLALGYRFYLDKLFCPSGVPKFSPESLYPIDIHSCSEAILCVSQLGPELGGMERIAPILRFISEKMRTVESYYIAEIRKRWWGEQKVRIPYVRWGQAWMLLALARCDALQAKRG